MSPISTFFSVIFGLLCTPALERALWHRMSLVFVFAVAADVDASIELAVEANDAFIQRLETIAAAAQRTISSD